MTAHSIPPSRSDVGTERERATAQFPAHTAHVSEARHFARGALTACGAHDLVDDLELVTSELVTNAVEHGRGDLIDLAIACDGREVTLSVTSRGNTDQVGPSERWSIADPDSITGRGLGIVSALTDRIDVRRRADELRIVVACQLRTCTPV